MPALIIGLLLGAFLGEAVAITNLHKKIKDGKPIVVEDRVYIAERRD